MEKLQNTSVCRKIIYKFLYFRIFIGKMWNSVPIKTDPVLVINVCWQAKNRLVLKIVCFNLYLVHRNLYQKINYTIK